MQNTQTQHPPREFINAREVGSLLGLSHSAVYAKVKKNEIPFYRVPNSSRVIFKRDEVLSWLIRSDA